MEISSFTRWSSTITQSVTYSSIPCRVMVFSPRSPVTMAVTPRSSSQRASRLSSRPDSRVVAEHAEQHLQGVQHHAPGADPADRVVEDQEEWFEVERPGGQDVCGIDLEREHREQAVLLELVEVEAERAHVQGDLLRRLLEAQQHTGLAVLPGPAHQELQAEQRLARSRGCRPPVTPGPGAARPR